MAKNTAKSEGWAATHRYARISARKARLVMATIRGMDCDAALDALRFDHHRASGMIADVLKSAMANANEQEADMSRLYVDSARVDEGPYYRRWRPKDRGRAHPIAKRTSHLFVRVVD
ncbi:MAG: 50S ribosomal protein L22 [bacterium]|nr:50S ribosomal protein L22 [bacterium]